MGSRSWIGGLAALVAGCAGPVGPSPAPTAVAAAPAVAPPITMPAPVPTPDPDRPLGPPEAAAWVFGKVEATWRVEGERVALYVLREPFAGKATGTATSRYLRLDGKVHAIHWDDDAVFAALTPGTTANLYPGANVACTDDPSHAAGNRCWRLMRVFPGPRARPPLTLAR